MSPKLASNINMSGNTGILLKSSNGFGKTIAACSFAVKGKVYLAYVDKKEPTELLKFFKEHRPELLANIEYDVFGSKNINDLLNTYIDFAEKGHRYEAIITDGVTSATTAAINWSLSFREDAPQKGKRYTTGEQLIPDFDDYKVETSLLTNLLDISKGFNCYNIWTCHPLPRLDFQGTGRTMTVTKSSSIVSYGNKVGALVPTYFNEIYHLTRRTDYQGVGTKISRIVCTDMIGDDFAKTSLNLPKEFDITDKLFYEVWSDLLKGK